MDKLQALYAELESTQDFLERMELQEQIDDIKMKTGEMLPPKPITSDGYECIGCSG